MQTDEHHSSLIRSSAAAAHSSPLMQGVRTFAAFAATSAWQSGKGTGGRQQLLVRNSFLPPLSLPCMSTEESRKRKRWPATTTAAATPRSGTDSMEPEGMSEMHGTGNLFSGHEHAEKALAEILSTVDDGDLPSGWLLGVCNSLERLTSTAKIQISEKDVLSKATEDGNATDELGAEENAQSLELRAAKSGIVAASSLCNIASHYGPAKGKGRKALRTVSLTLDSDPLAAIVVASALAMGTGEDDGTALCRAAASAVLPDGRYDNSWRGEKIGTSRRQNGTGRNLAVTTVEGLLQFVTQGNNVSAGVTVDLHIVTAISRAFIGDATPLASVCVEVLKKTLHIRDNDEAEGSDASQLSKRDAAPSLALAAQLSPFSSMSPVPLIERAVRLDLWHAAERLCDSAISAESSDSSEAVRTLVDSAFDQHLYRQADAMATKFYDTGGRDRYVEARLEHACETISKVIQKRQFPIIEKQIDRVDRAFKRVHQDLCGSRDEATLLADKEEPLEVRTFALRRLREANQNDFARRLAQLYGMPYHYNAEDAKRDEQERRERYLQFEEVFDMEVPDVISNPNLLRRSFAVFEQNDKGAIGFDVEWGDDSPGAALLQISTTAAAILVDIPALSVTEDGTSALEDTVGKMFAGARGSVVGFGCKEDLSRLRASPFERGKNASGGGHWLVAGTAAAVDLKVLIAEDDPSLRHLGLSKVCNHYLGKPLDKAEQCSLWTRRPLSMEQRVYAALDARACAAVHAKLSINP